VQIHSISLSSIFSSSLLDEWHLAITIINGWD
jgi:hypothetical protein